MSDATPLARLTAALAGTIFGQPRVLADLVTAFLARGHVLLEGVPGVAKTLTARSMAGALGLLFTRIQFTPDLMPADILGTNIFQPQDNAFRLVKGPIFTEVLVADEINRTPPKAQAALLEAMEERQVTIDGVTHPLPPHFFVVATQNPLELEGTYPLPEAQLDRFLMRIRVGYPDSDSETTMLRAFHQREGRPPSVDRVLDAPTLAELQARAARVTCDESILQYVVAVVRDTRANPRVRLGASPRAAQALLAASKARAALMGNDFVTPDDVKGAAGSVLNHRLLLKAEAEVEGVTADDVLKQTLERVRVPR
ncbi:MULTISPECIES: MoxR family ATPase [Myxococcus]|uniref:MoxR family ATPase n=1 Tax=Myxococcus llanfairpwllgwyngyllgogerychwyrndrobwllllantysiliogogogochensis TaxID=2590453 RepID=A0A540X1C8_9BACT|nr:MULTISPECIES: MoxR family ATPase [Myxococcus]NTX01560.1 MoxR family ATPase [Myxococcus sp. CA040A]NTX16200.1 MoxR family ATPase [Myxococcus sp. CA056]NTX40115.1 MoxR family ATPase [Myxococcus sp. CA033]NTX52304.1 MoxR family ATPase [Myxococcus sp. CA039A]TQF15077.1 MoxR family ATPase [Myxococcus llanfairpwllgwyngyllgogerychwyrndrobwllllantysiliogogogochensis]